MNIFKRVTKNTLREAKIRTVVTIVGVVLASCLFTAATTFIGSMLNYAEEVTKKDGDYYVELADNDDTLYTKMKSDKEVAYMTKENYVGQGKFNDYDTVVKDKLNNGEYFNVVYTEDMYGYIYGIDDKHSILEEMDIVKGRMPKSSKELLISKEMALSLGEKAAVGNVISISIMKEEVSYGEEVEKSYSENDENYTQPYQYTIVGHHDNLQSSRAYTYIDENIVSKESNLYVKLNKKFKLDIEEFLAKYNIDIEDGEKVKYVNSYMLAFSGSFKDADDITKYSWLFAIFFIIIAVASIVLISSTFMISVSERTKQFGLLSSIGATKKQLCKSLLYEAAYVSTVGIPVGILIGLVGMGITIKCLGVDISKMILSLGSVDREITELKYMIHPIALLVAIVLTLCTIGISLLIPIIRLRNVTAIEAIRQSKEVKVRGKRVRVSRLTKNLVGIEGIIATKYYKVSSSKYIVTVVSLAMSMVLFIVSFSVSSMASVIVDKDINHYPYDIRVEDVFIDNENYSMKDNTIKTKEFVENIKELKGAKGVKYSFSVWESIIVNREDINAEYIKDSDWYGDYVEATKDEKIHNGLNDNADINDVPEKIVKGVNILYIDNEQYNEILEKEGLDKSKYIGVSEPKALVYNRADYGDSNSCEIFNKTNNKLTVMDSDKLDMVAMGYGGNYTYECNLWPNCLYIDNYKNIGEGKVAYYDFDEEHSQIGLKEGELFTKELAVGDYIYSLPYISEHIGDDNIFVIYPESAVKGRVNCNAYIKVEEYKSFSLEFYKLLSRYGIYKDQVEDFCEKNNLIESIMFIVKVFIYGFLILVALTSVANVFNTITTNVILRRRDIATLRSIGLSGKNVDKMLRYECFIYGIKATVIGLPLALVANYGISKVLGIDGFSDYGVNNIVNYLSLLIPFKAIIISVIVVLVIVYISMFYAINIIKKDNILDTLKNENI